MVEVFADEKTTLEIMKQNPYCNDCKTKEVKMTYEQIMYEKLLIHQNCTVQVDVNFEHLPNPGEWTITEYEISAIEIANYHDGENMAIECVSCNEIIVDFNKE